MTCLNLVANELVNAGFKAIVTQYGVEVSLNRPVNRLEVWTALDDLIEDVSFKINILDNIVLVRVF